MRCAVLGAPIAHSLSPQLHHAAYDVLGLDWSYERVEVTGATLPAFLDGLDDGWRGLSLTMPLKRSVVPLLDSVDERGAQGRAVNTVVLEGGSRAGHNTDVPGLAAALRERTDAPVTRAVVVGGGATAASAVLALADLGCEHVTLVVRDPARAAETIATAARHPAGPHVQVVPLAAAAPVAADVLVSTVPATAQDQRVLGLAAAVPVVFEVVYDPWPTPVARAATTAGQVLVAGLDLLVHQAALQVALMTGLEAPLAAMREAGQRALAARAARPA